MSDDKLMKARCRLMTREPWYGHIAMSMVWIPSEMVGMEEARRTMGVRIVNGEVQCLYYPPFVEKLSIEELYAVVQHEIEHIVRMHCVRITNDHDRLGWNIAADMCVNGSATKPRIGYTDLVSGKIIVPLDGKIIWIPSDWPQDETTEYYYERLEKQGKPNGDTLDNHDIWNESDASADEVRQIVKDMVAQASEKAQGQVPSHLQSSIDKLSKPIVKWQQLLHQYLGKHVGNRRHTYSRRNRRRDSFGMPGISLHAAAKVNVIIDTSGSVSDDELKQFFTEIESMSANVRTSVLQWDSQFQGYNRYRRGDWRRLKVNGRGGTDMAAPIKWLIDNRQIADAQIMLTDGCCNYLPKTEVLFPVITIVTQAESAGASIPDYGHVIRMKP